MEHSKGEANGHISFQNAKSLVKNKYITGVRLEYTPSNQKLFCKSCVYAKATRKSVPSVQEGERASEFGGEIHLDLWVKSPVESKCRKLYYVTFIDDKTRLTHLYFLKTKDETAAAYKKYEAWVEEEGQDFEYRQGRGVPREGFCCLPQIQRHGPKIECPRPTAASRSCG